MKYAFSMLLLFIAATSFCQQPTPNPKLQQYYQQQFTENIKQQLDKIDWTHASKTTHNDTVLYTIPVVVHVLHNYEGELLADSTIYNTIKTINNYLLQNIPDTANIIAKFKPVDASTQIILKLAAIDPGGNPTKGIEHIYTYLTYNAYNQSKVNLWPPSRYLNIWTTNSTLYPQADVYTTPSQAQAAPYYDGIIILYNYLSSLSGIVPSYLGLRTPCGFSNSNQNQCIDNDLIADTPPCNEVYTTNIYDSVCDTPNVQNIMNYNPPNISFMFTYGQGQFMQAALQQSIGQRDSLVTPTTRTLTGINQPMPDLLPIADFSVTASSAFNRLQSFFWPGQWVSCNNHSWNDTIISSQWSFSSSAQTPSASTFNATNKFSQPGWDSATLIVTGNNTGHASITKSFFIADTNATNGQNYYQEFNPGGDLDKWPMFNYYNNNFKWQLANVGYYDNTSAEYAVYDTRTFPHNATGSSNGDVDDIYTPVFDLSVLTDTGFFNFYSSGAYRADTNLFYDQFEIDYSTNGSYWQTLKIFGQGAIDNKGLQPQAYTPQSQSDWKPQSVPLPPNARVGKVVFRLRYMPGTVILYKSAALVADINNGYSASNNFYIDRINFSSYPTGINAVTANSFISIYPNPATTSVSITVAEPGNIGALNVSITDITGKQVFGQQTTVNSNNTTIHIPISGTLAKGLYMVTVITARQTTTQKLIIN